jgi:hypothetical protein
MVIPPIAAVVAGPEPEILAKIIEANEVAIANPPVNLSMMAELRETSFADIPPLSMIIPERIKKGTAKNTKESVPLNIC